MTKYIIVGYSNPDLKTAKADVKVLGEIFGRIFFTESNKDSDIWKVFDTRTEAEEYIQNHRLDCCISYGVEID